MSSFLGTDTHSIDHKGRISIPASMRRTETGRAITRFVLNMGFDGCVHGYSKDEWKRMMERLRKIPISNPQGRAFRRAFLTDAKEVQVDAQGRVPIPPALVRRASLDKEAVVHGADVLHRHFERIGGDLGTDGFQALADGRGADIDRDLAVGFEHEARALLRA